MKDEINVERDIIPRADLLRFVVGLLDHMRARGAVINDVTRLYVQREANWYAVGKSYNGGRNSLPSYAPAAPKPCFPANRVLSRFEPVATDGAGGWYVPWFYKCFDPVLTLTGELSREFYALLFEVLGSHAIVERAPVGTNQDGASAAWDFAPKQ